MVEKDRILQNESLVDIMILSKKLNLAVTAARKIRNELKKLDKILDEAGDVKEEVRKAVERFEIKFTVHEDEIVPKELFYRGSMEMALRGGPLILQIMSLGSSISSYPTAPSEEDLAQLNELKQGVSVLVERFNGFIRTEIPRLNETLEKNSLKPIKSPGEVEI